MFRSTIVLKFELIVGESEVINDDPHAFYFSNVRLLDHCDFVGDGFALPLFDCEFSPDPTSDVLVVLCMADAADPFPMGRQRAELIDLRGIPLELCLQLCVFVG